MTQAAVETEAGITPGAHYLGQRRCRFGVWAPGCSEAAVRLTAPFEKTVPMEPLGEGLFRAMVDNVEPGTRYLFRLDGTRDLPDPASRFQPEGVHGPSEVVDPHFDWKDHYWCGLPLADLILYELHVGTFTPEGTFDAAAAALPRLGELGVTAVELMPVAQFPGERNWGYDGVFPYAVQNSYGGPAALKRFVDAAHKLGMAAVLDVVYNHIGPEGNVFPEFGPYFTDAYRTPWGESINFDGRDSDQVRRFFIGNAVRWIEEFHFDALRLDAIHEIPDLSARPFLEELGAAVHDFGRSANRLVYLIAETIRNDPRLLRQRELGGIGLDAQWADDFHHALHALLTGERNGYYVDFGEVGHLAKVFREGYFFTGQYSAWRRRRHGAPADQIPARKIAVCAQNHDQIGNRPGGERFGTLLSFEAQKLAAAAVLLSPYLPLMFMGDEYGETAPFFFFTDHSDAALTEAVRKGRAREFKAFSWRGEHPDPADPETFERSKIDPALADKGRHRKLFELYRELIGLRKAHPALRGPGKERMQVMETEGSEALLVLRTSDSGDAFAVLHFGDMPASPALPLPPGNWRRLIDSAHERWGGGGSRAPELLGASSGQAIELAPKSFVLYDRVPESADEPRGGLL